MKELFKEKARNIKIIICKEEILDPIEKNTKKIPIMYIPIKAIVADLSFSKVQWVMPGVTVSKAKEIIIQRKDYNKINLSSSIFIENETYIGFKANGRFQYKETDDKAYIRCFIYIKQIK